MQVLAYRSIKLKVLLIFAKLKLDPGRFRVTISVPFGKYLVCLLALVASVEPSWGLGNKHAENEDQARENHL